MDRALNTSNCAFTDFLVTREDVVAGNARPASIFYTPVYSLSSKEKVLGMERANPPNLCFSFPQPNLSD